MYRFIVLGHRAITSKDFSLNDLCGSAGRMDVLLRCINSAFFLSHDIRRDIELYLVLQGEPDPPKTIHMIGKELKYLNPDERSTGALVRNALMKKLEKNESTDVKSTPGIYVSRDDFLGILNKLSNISTLVYLKEDGEPFDSLESEKNLTFILSDDKNMTQEEENRIQEYQPKMISLGPRSYHSDHCITVVLWQLDNMVVKTI
jgi:tRNA (pseudouridine54-N1)-methyltransferase